MEDRKSIFQFHVQEDHRHTTTNRALKTDIMPILAVYHQQRILIPILAPHPYLHLSLLTSIRHTTTNERALKVDILTILAQHTNSDIHLSSHT